MKKKILCGLMAVLLTFTCLPVYAEEALNTAPENTAAESEEQLSGEMAAPAEEELIVPETPAEAPAETPSEAPAQEAPAGEPTFIDPDAYEDPADVLDDIDYSKDGFVDAASEYDHVPEEVQAAIENGTEGQVEETEAYEGAMQYQTLRKNVGNKTVTVSGSMPKNATLEVFEYSNDDALFYVQKTIDGFAEPENVVFMVDITIYDENGNKYEPEEGTLDVSITSSEVRTAGDGAELYHIPEEAKTSSEAILAESVDADIANNKISFEADEFSPFVLTALTQETAAAPTRCVVMVLERSSSSKPKLYLEGNCGPQGAPDYVEIAGVDNGAARLRMRAGTGTGYNEYTAKEIWFIRKNLNTNNYFIRHILSGYNIGAYKYDSAGIYGMYAQNPQQQWTVTKNANGTYTFQNVYVTADQGRACVLDVEGGEPDAANNSDVQCHRSNGSAAQQFKLYRAVTHNTTYTVTSKTESSSIGRNNLSLWNLNNRNLPQNTVAGLRQNYKLGSTALTASIETGAQGRLGTGDAWKASDGGQALPALKVTLPRNSAEWVKEDCYVEMTYPVCGTYFDGQKTIAVGSKVKYYNFRAVDAASIVNGYYLFDETAYATNNKIMLYLSPNMYGGYWYYGNCGMDIDVTFYEYDMESGTLSDEPLVMKESFLTFNSLNDQQRQYRPQQPNPWFLDRNIPNDAFYTEFVGKLTTTKESRQVGNLTYTGYTSDSSAIGYVTGPLGNASSATTARVTNVMSMDLELWPPFADNTMNYGTYSVFGTQHKFAANGEDDLAAPWTDSMGGLNFTRNSVSLKLNDDVATTSFIVGAVEGAVWNSWSTLSVNVTPDKPIKEIIKASGTFHQLNDDYDLEDNQYSAEEEDRDGHMDNAYVSLSDGKAIYHIIQKVPQIGVDMNEALDSFYVTDAVPSELKIVSGGSDEPDRVKDGVWTTSPNWTYAIDGNNVTFTYTGGYNELETSGNGMLVLDGDIYGHFYICVDVSDSEAATTYSNNGITHFKQHNADQESPTITTNTVFVTPLADFGTPQITKAVDRVSNNIGETHTYTVSFPVPENIADNGANCVLTLTDEIDDRLTLVGTPSVSVKKGSAAASPLTANTDYRFTLDEGLMTFTFGGSNYYTRLADNDTADTSFIITYKAFINNTANPGDHIPNVANLKYGYNDGLLDKTTTIPSNEVYVYTGELTAKKESIDGEKIVGASFALKDGNGKYVLKSGSVVYTPDAVGYNEDDYDMYTVTTGDDGIIRFSGIKDGTYYVEELATITGYLLAPDTQVVVAGGASASSNIVIIDPPGTTTDNVTIVKTVDKASYDSGKYDVQTWTLSALMYAEDYFSAVTFKDPLDNRLVYQSLEGVTLSPADLQDPTAPVTLTGEDYTAGVAAEGGKNVLTVSLTAKGLTKLGNYQKNFEKGKGINLAVSYKTAINLSGYDSWASKDIPNKATITYTGYGDEKTKESNEVTVHTGDLTVTKYDAETNEVIPGVTFALYTKVGEEYFPVLKENDSNFVHSLAEKGFTGYDGLSQNLVYNLTTESNGSAVFKGVHDGTYYLKETKTVAGYQLSADYIPVIVRDGVGNISVYDSKPEVLTAGGEGSNFKPIMLIGCGILAAAAVMFLCQKKKFWEILKEKVRR